MSALFHGGQLHRRCPGQPCLLRPKPSPRQSPYLSPDRAGASPAGSIDCNHPRRATWATFPRWNVFDFYLAGDRLPALALLSAAVIVAGTLPSEILPRAANGQQSPSGARTGKSWPNRPGSFSGHSPQPARSHHGPGGPKTLRRIPQRQSLWKLSASAYTGVSNPS